MPETSQATQEMDAEAERMLRGMQESQLNRSSPPVHVHHPDLLAILREFVELRAANRWIPTSEKTTRDDELVLIGGTFNGKQWIGAGKWIDAPDGQRSGWWNKFGVEWPVEFWRPLPEPPAATEERR